MKLIATLLICALASMAAQSSPPPAPPISTPYNPAHPCVVPDNATLMGKEHPCLAPELAQPTQKQHRFKNAMKSIGISAIGVVIFVIWIYSSGH